MLKALDCFGIPVQFKFKSQLYITTLCGQVTSGIAIAIIIIYIICYIVNETNRDMPLVTSNESFPKLNYTFFPDEKNFKENGKDMDLDEKSKDNGYLQIILGVRHREKGSWEQIGTETFKIYDNSNSKVYSSPTNCKSFDHVGKDEYNYLDLNNTFCLVDNFTVSNQPDGNYLTIEFKPISTVAPFPFDFYILYNNAIFNQPNRKHPIHSYIDYKVIELSASTLQTVFMNFRKNEVTTYFNMMPKKYAGKIKDHEYYINFDEDSFSINPSQRTDDDPVIRIEIRGSSHITSYDVTYTSVFDIIGRVGGFIQFIILLCGFFVLFTAPFRQKEMLVNEIYCLVNPERPFLKEIESKYDEKDTPFPDYDENEMEEIKKNYGQYIDLLICFYNKYVYTEATKLKKLKNYMNERKNSSLSISKVEDATYMGNDATDMNHKEKEVKKEQENKKENKKEQGELDKTQENLKKEFDEYELENKKITKKDLYKKQFIKFFMDKRHDYKKAKELIYPSKCMEKKSDQYEEEDSKLNEKKLIINALHIAFILGTEMIDQGITYKPCCLCTYCCCNCCLSDVNKKKKKIFNDAVKRLEEDTDFVTLFNCIQKFEGAKQILLNNDTHIPLLKAIANKAFYPEKEKTGYELIEEQNKKEIVDPVKEMENKVKAEYKGDLYESLNSIYENIIKIVQDPRFNDEMEKSLIDERFNLESLKLNIVNIENLISEFNKNNEKEKTNKKFQEFTKQNMGMEEVEEVNKMNKY